MEVDTIPLSNASGAVDKPSVLFSLVDMETFEEQYLADVAAREEAKAEEQAAKDAAKKKPKNQTSPPSSINTALPASSPVPIPISKVSTADTVVFIQKCQIHGIVAEFDYAGSAEIATWTSKLTLQLPNVAEKLTLETETAYSTKKAAKAAVCTRGLAVLKDLCDAGTLTLPVKTKSPKAPPAAATKEERAKPEENYIGLIYQHCDAKQAPAPEIREYTIPSTMPFSAELALSQLPGQTFGSSTTGWPTKKLARSAAAKAAVLHLREAGEMPPAGVPVSVKKRKVDGASCADGCASTPTAANARARVVVLAEMLGLPQARYQYEEADPRWPALYTVSAVFDGTGIGGETGDLLVTVRMVDGKQRAKDRCAVEAVVELERILAERRAVARDAVGEDGGMEEVWEDAREDVEGQGEKMEE